jgi:hypothetical protein
MPAISDAITTPWGRPGAFLRLLPTLPSIDLDFDYVRPWIPVVGARLRELDALPTVPGRAPLNHPDLIAALDFLSRNMRDDTRPPWIGLLSSGGLELSWNCGDVEVEAVFDERRGENEVIVAVAGREWDSPVRDADQLFASVVDRLSA